MERLAYTISEVMEKVPIGRTYLYQLIKTGQLRTISLGKRRLVTVDALRDLIESGSAS